MASAQESFDAEKTRREIFQGRNRNIFMIIKFVAETAKVLKEKARENDLVYITDRSIELLQGNLKLKKVMLRQIICKCDKNLECAKMLKYYLKLEKLLNNTVDEKSLRISNLLNTGKKYFATADYRKTIEYTLRAEKISDELKDKSGKAVSCGDLGNAYLRLAEYKKAIEYHNKSLEINIEIGNRLGIGYDNVNLGNAYCYLGQYQKAIEYGNKGLFISTEIENQLGIVSSNTILGNAYYCLGQYEIAIENISKALAISIEIKERSGIECNSYVNLAANYCSLGQYEKAIECCSKSLEIGTEIGDRLTLACSNMNLGNVYISLGQYLKAIEYHSKGLAISIEIEDRLGIAKSNGCLGIAYRCLGQYKKAIDYYSKGLAISIEIGDRSGIAGKSEQLGNAYLCLNHYQKAIEYHNKSLEINIELEDLTGIASTTANMGNVYLIMKQYKKAIECFNKSLALSIDTGLRSGMAGNNENLGNAYRNLGQYEKAMTYFKKALEISTEFGDRFGECTSMGNIGESYLILHGITSKTEDIDKLQNAVSFLKKSVVCGDKILFDLDVDENKISFIHKYFEQYVTLLHCFILLKRIEAALLVSDLGKAKALHAFYEKRKKSDDMSNYTKKTWQKIDNIEEKVQTSDIEKVLQLKRNNCTVLFYSFDRDMFLNIWVLNGKDRIRHKSVSLSKIIIWFYLTELLTPLSVDLNRDSSFYKLYFGVNPRKENIAVVPFGEMSINGKSTDEKEVSKISNLGISENKLLKKFQSCDDIFPYKTSDTPLKTELVKILEHYDLAIDTSRMLMTPLKALFQILIKPVENFIKGSKLIIVPDEFIFFAPFCALQTENGCPISKDYSIQITPSLHTLCVSTAQSHQASLGFALFVGNPSVGKVMFREEQIEPSNLSNATAEAKCLARLFDAQPLVEGEAVKERVLRLIHGASIIHIAAHGDQKRGEIFLAPNPDLNYQGSSLPKEESYLVREKDIIGIRTNALLVVLCCCHTGSGKISSEGVIGVARAFLAAGARSVLATLWPIHDEGTKLFMEYFYNEICKETSICEALRKTMNIFQQHENQFYRKVQVWAPFTIYGEDVKFSQSDIEEIKQKSRGTSF